jgi:hypothetical protein
MRGVKTFQFMCKKTGSKRMRREEAAKNYGHWQEGREREGLAWNDNPTTRLEVIPKPSGFG